MEKRCSGTPPPEKQSWTTTSYLIAEGSSASTIALLFLTHPLASCRNTLLIPGSDRPKYWRAASYTAGSISTIVVAMPCWAKAFAEIPVPRPLYVKAIILAWASTRVTTYIMSA
jgi:hypothetical protein